MRRFFIPVPGSSFRAVMRVLGESGSKVKEVDDRRLLAEFAKLGVIGGNRLWQFVYSEHSPAAAKAFNNLAKHALVEVCEASVTKGKSKGWGMKMVSVPEGPELSIFLQPRQALAAAAAPAVPAAQPQPEKLPAPLMQPQPKLPGRYRSGALETMRRITSKLTDK